MAKKRLLTLEQLVKFCQENNFQKFSSEDSGYTLSVQIPGTLNFSENKDDSIMYVNVKVCHTLLNRNGSFISEKNMKNAMPTLKYKPLLASIIEINNGEFDFNSHDMEIVEDEDGNASVEYIEKQIGAFTVDEPYLEYDKDMDKTYVIATAAIPREYSKAAEIIERKNGTKVSCELSINSMSYNAKENYLELEDFIFMGVTCLGDHIGEGMIGSRLDIADFSTENNSVKFEQNDKLIETLEKLNETLSNFNIQADKTANTTKEGGEQTVSKFEELLVKYNKTVEDITFEYENLSDEELEAAFAEAFAEADPEEGEPEGEPENDGEDDTTTEPEGEPEDDSEPTDEFAVKYSVEMGDAKKDFSISLNDKIYALQTLVNDTYEADGDWYCVDVFDDEKYVEMHGWLKSYRQSYKVKKDSYTLVGDRTEVFAKYLTQDQINALDKMKSDFALVSEKLNKYEEEPKKMEILESDDYSQIANNEEFEALKNKDAHFDMSIDEVRAKADELLLAYAKTGSLKFESHEEKHENKTTHKNLYSLENNTNRRYGNIFDK